MAEYLRLRIMKRKNDLICSRWAVKQLARKCDPELERLGLPELQVCKEPSGRPYLALSSGERIAGSISLSHSAGSVLAAFSHTTLRMGVDLERVEVREAAFAQDFFTEQELRMVESARAEERDGLITLIWSAKEAVLKAIGTGLRIDTRKINVDPDRTAYYDGRWSVAKAHCEAAGADALQLLWRREADFVFCICILGGQDFRITEVAANDQNGPVIQG
jgi:4'-phosphopantetheinyl transferase